MLGGKSEGWETTVCNGYANIEMDVWCDENGYNERLMWYGHVMRRAKCNVVKKVLSMIIEGFKVKGIA